MKKSSETPDLNVKNIPNLTTQELFTLSPQNLRNLNEAQLQAFTSEQILKFSQEQFTAFFENPNLSTYRKFEELIPKLNAWQIKLIKPNAINALGENLKLFNKKQISFLNKEQLKAIKAEHFNAIQEHLTSNQKELLQNPEIPIAVPETDVNRKSTLTALDSEANKKPILTADNIKGLNDEELRAISPDQIKEMDENSFKAFVAKGNKLPIIENNGTSQNGWYNFNELQLQEIEIQAKKYGININTDLPSPVINSEPNANISEEENYKTYAFIPAENGNLLVNLVQEFQVEYSKAMEESEDLPPRSIYMIRAINNFLNDTDQQPLVPISSANKDSEGNLQCNFRYPKGHSLAGEVFMTTKENPEGKITQVNMKEGAKLIRTDKEGNTLIMEATKKGVSVSIINIKGEVKNTSNDIELKNFGIDPNMQISINNIRQPNLNMAQTPQRRLSREKITPPLRRNSSPPTYSPPSFS